MATFAPTGLLDPTMFTPEQLQEVKSNALTNALLGAGFQALAGSQALGYRPSTAQILGQAGQAGLQSYQGTFDQALQNILKQQQLADLQRKRQQEVLASQRQSQIQQALGLPMQQRIDALRGLGAYEELSQMGAAEKAIRPLTRGAGEVSMENPFMVYQQSEIPSVKRLADQYAKAYETGAIDDEKATVRIGELGRMEESALSRRESAAERKLTREQMAVERQINREVQQTERDLKRMEGTEGQKLAAGFASRMEAANEILEQLEPAGGLPTEFTELASGVPFFGGYLQRKAMTPEQQRYKQAADNWIRANLRKESGAAIPPEEMALEYETYFPMPGDDTTTIQQKADARRITTEAMKQNAGPVYRPTRGSTRPNLNSIKSNYGLEP